MSLILKNTTSSDIRVEGTGKVLPANGQKSVQPSDYTLYQAAALSNATFQTQLASGDVVVNFVGDDLTAVQGLRYLETFSALEVQVDGTPIGKAITTINLQNPPSASISGVQLDVDLTPDEEDFTGGIFSLQFTTDNDSEDTWLQLSHNNLSCSQTPYHVPFNCKLIALTIGSDDDGEDYEFEFYKLPYNSNTSTLFHTEIANNTRFVTNRTITNSNYTFAPGDKIGVFCVNEHDDVNVQMWFKITSSPVIYLTDNNNTDVDD